MKTRFFSLGGASYAFSVKRAFVVSSVIATFLLLASVSSVSAQTVTEVAAELAEVTRDETITHEDLGTVASTVLPDSPFHFFKRFGRGFQEAFTFDPVRDAELKLQHANQQLAETKQLIEQKGIANIEPAILKSAINNFKSKVSDVESTARALKTAKGREPEIVDKLLNEVTDKQLKQQKVLDVIGKQVLSVKQAVADGTADNGKQIEEVLTTVDETKDAGMAGLADFLANVEDSAQNIGVRVTNVMDRQNGSEFKDLKNLELLSAMQSKVPENAKDAMEVAKKNTIEKFEARVKEMPPTVRAEKLKLYVEQSTNDETRLLSLLNDLKASPNVPTDVLAKLEEAKEIVVRKFENKLKVVDNADVAAGFLDRFGTQSVDDLATLEEFTARMKTGSDETKKMAQLQEKSLDEFKKNFTDATAQNQADRYQKLSQELLTSPTAKTFKLLNDLQRDTAADPNKKAFLDKVSEDMKRQFENQYRREGDKFMDRVATLDPEDLAALQSFKFDGAFTDRLVKRSADQFKDYMKVVDDPDQFADFHERFFDAPKEVIESIKRNDAGFQDAVQFKVRKMAEVQMEKERQITRATLDYKERELDHQTGRVDRKAEDEFWNQLNELPPDAFDKRKELWENKISDAYARTEEKYTERRKIFEEKLKIDPWCDEVCQVIQLQSMEQNLRFEKERLADDLAREQRKNEIEKARMSQTTQIPTACNSPETCATYCQQNPGVQFCSGLVIAPVVQFCAYPAYWDPGQKKCTTPTNVSEASSNNFAVAQNCTTGQYWDYVKKTCVTDPYYRATPVLQGCSYGMQWNPRTGACDFDTTLIYAPLPGALPTVYPQPGAAFCGSGFRYEASRKECVPSDFQTCAAGQYYDFYERRCKAEWKDCGVGSYWDPARAQCIKNTVASPTDGGVCPPGFHRDQTNACVADWSDVAPINTYCPSNQTWNAASRRCEGARPIEYCTQEYAPVCGTDGATYSNACYAKQAGVAVKSQGACVKTEPVKSCTPNKYNSGGTYACDYSVCSSGCKFDFNGCPSSCAETSPVCPAGQTWDSVSRTCTGSPSCKTTCDSSCDYKSGSYCMYDKSGCAAGCAPACPAGSYYHQDIGKCATQQEYDTLNGCKGAQYYDEYFKACRDQYCASGWKWDEASYSCISSTDPSCKSTCSPACGTGGSYCLFDGKGCAAGCSPTCPENQYYDQMQKKCVGYYKPSVCPDNGFNTGSGSTACSFTKCSSGCNYDDKGCPTACYTPPPSTCTDNGYNMKGTAACDYSKCSSGCSWDGKGCPSGCYVGSTECNYNKVCDGKESNQTCPSDCYVSGNPYCGDGVCNGAETASSCSKDCGTTGDSSSDMCKNMTGWHYDSTTKTCVKDGTTCSNPSSCSACPMGSGGSSWCSYDMNGCPTGCQTSSGTCNYNKICDAGETVSSCANDCGGSSTSVCDGVADTNQSECIKYTNCHWKAEASPAYCYYEMGSSTACDYDKVCESGESSGSCPNDCGSTTTCPSTIANNYVSGSKTCYSTSCTGGCNYDGQGCPSTCWSSGSSGGGSDSGSCTGNTFNGNATTKWACSMSTCSGGCNFDSNGCATSCMSGSSAGYCGNAFCESYETASSCPGDCGASTPPATTCPSNGYNSGAGSYSCNYSTCSNGCSYDSAGCPSGCMTSMCSDNGFNQPGTMMCDNSKCANGCTWSGSCPSGCYTMPTSSLFKRLGTLLYAMITIPARAMGF